MRIYRIWEEVFPFDPYRRNVKRLKKRRDRKDILRKDGYTEFEILSVDQLEQRLDEERQRAVALDEKTFKLTLSFTLGLTILGSTAAFVAKGVSSNAVEAVIGIGILFVLGAGGVALTALQTAPSYGYGTHFLLHLQKQGNKQRVLADALARQETMNQIRQLRNEVSFQALRNGLVLVFAGIVLFFVAAVYEPPGGIQPNAGPQAENASTILNDQQPPRSEAPAPPHAP